jgi:very-short-patch-repair endonuclease
MKKEDTRFKKRQLPWNKGIPMREESRKKLSESQKGKVSWSKGRKFLERSGENHPMFEKHHSEESLRKMSEAKKGKMVGEKNPFYGKIHSEETRKKISEARKGRPSPMKGKKTGKPAWNKGLKTDAIPWNKGKKLPYTAHPKMKGHIPWNKGTKGVYSEEIRRRMSEAQKKFWTPELRKKRSESLKGKYAGKDNPSYGRKQSEEAKKVHSIFLKEYWKTHKHPMTGRKPSREQIERLRQYSLGRPSPKKGIKMPERSEWGRQNMLKQFESGTFPSKFNTKPERQIKEELIKRGYKERIDFIHQYKFMNKFMCDFCFPQQKIIVEVDGDFWHANPNKYPEGSTLHKHQVKGIGRDKSKNAYISKVDNGSWTIVRLWESDIKKDVAGCVDKIEEILKNKTNAFNLTKPTATI